MPNILSTTALVDNTCVYSVSIIFPLYKLSDYELPWEDKSLQYPSNMATGLEVAVQASNGASDYGNKFGEPVLTGFARSFGMMINETDRREWVKPIMFSAGMGSLEAEHISKETPSQGQFAHTIYNFFQANKTRNKLVGKNVVN